MLKKEKIKSKIKKKEKIKPLSHEVSPENQANSAISPESESKCSTKRSMHDSQFKLQKHKALKGTTKGKKIKMI